VAEENKPEAEAPHDVNKIVAERREKLHALRATGTAYPNDFRRTALAARLANDHGELDKAALEAKQIQVAVAGRMMLKRVMGKASFATIQDGSTGPQGGPGRIQVYVSNDVSGEAAHDAFKHWDLGDLIGVRGTLFKTNKGELTVQASELRLLAKALRPLPEKFHGLADQELRYRQRYVDLIVNPPVREVFAARSRIVQSLREALVAEHYLEVETPMMQPIPGGAVARPFKTHHNTLNMDLFLRIAPELYLKRLVVGGFERVYEINRNFRNEGISTRHNPEFTMLEFYWAYASYEDLMTLTEEMLAGIAGTVVGGSAIPWGDSTLNLKRPWRRFSMRDAVLAHSDLRPEDLGERAKLEAAARRFDIKDVARLTSGKLLAEVFEATAERSLQDPTFIVDFPADISPLAKRKPGEPDLTERFELYIGGLELANAFTELNDPDDQRRRFEEQARVAGGVVDEDYLLSLEYGMPPTAGEGIGIDRLVMLLTDSHSIRDVILFPLLRPRE
jgi:lysyl-tRNA synthetase class 2